MSDGETTTGIAVLAGLGLYLMPSIIGFLTNRAGKWLLLLSNVFFGWSGFGWILCFIHACLAPTPAKARWRKACRLHVRADLRAASW